MNNHWVLLRGLGRDHRHWGSFRNEFEQAFSTDRVSTIDTCGNGDFVIMKSPLLIAEYTDHCRKELGNKSKRINLIALSLGGMIALDWAQRFPEEVNSITLINSSVANLTPWYRRINTKALFKLVIPLLSQKSPEKIEKAILALTANLMNNNEILRQWTGCRETHCTSLVNLLRQLIAAARFNLQTPLNIAPLVLCSEEDKLVNCVASKDINKYLGGRIITHASAGHDLPLDDTAWVLEQIKSHYYM